MDPWDGVNCDGFNDPRPTSSQPGMGRSDCVFRRNTLSFVAARSVPFLAAIIRPGGDLDGFNDPRPTSSQPGMGRSDCVFRRNTLSFVAARSVPFLAAIIRPGGY